MAGYSAERISVAPMMDWTDRHCRYFHRLISRNAVLYTEMVTTGAVLHGDRERLLRFDATEHPVVLQLGGSDPDTLAEAVRIGEAYGYDGFNLNCGCPSDRVQRGTFGACLMAEPARVARCVAAMGRATRGPVTVKCRIGIDDRDSYDDLRRFVDIVADAGCATFVVHARKAWLHGLSPRENREIPPLRYPEVHRLKAERPDLAVVINGGIADLDAAQGQMARVDGVMIGRAAYQNPWLLAEVDRRFHAAAAAQPTREAVVHAMLGYIERELAAGTRLPAITRHMLGLFQGQPGARRWRRHLSENAHRPGADAGTVRDALARVGGSGARAAA
ncbi:MAG: tRNA dihydrouridine(20/20a) synthase DusA [Alphaproteobacteria bacterium]